MEEAAVNESFNISLNSSKVNSNRSQFSRSSKSPHCSTVKQTIHFENAHICVGLQQIEIVQSISIGITLICMQAMRLPLHLHSAIFAQCGCNTHSQFTLYQTEPCKCGRTNMVGIDGQRTAHRWRVRWVLHCTDGRHRHRDRPDKGRQERKNK